MKFITEIVFNSEVTFYAFTVNKKTIGIEKKLSNLRESLMMNELSVATVGSSFKTDLFPSKKINPPLFEFHYNLKKGCFTDAP